MIEEEGNYDIRNLIIETIREKNNETFLEQCFFIYEVTDNKGNSKRVKKLLEDEEIVRGINLLESVKEDAENKIYYYDEDKPSLKKLYFRKELENTVRKIRNKEITELAAILKELKDEGEIDL